MRARKFLVLLIAAGYLAAAQCRFACAGSFLPEQSRPAESACHNEGAEPKGDDADHACCDSHVESGALLPSDAPALAPNVLLPIAAIEPDAAVVASSGQFALRRDHDPPRKALEVLAASSRGPRPPPFGA